MSKFKTDIGLYEEHSSGALPFFGNKEMFVSIKEGERAPASNEN